MPQSSNDKARGQTVIHPSESNLFMCELNYSIISRDAPIAASASKSLVRSIAVLYHPADSINETLCFLSLLSFYQSTERHPRNLKQLDMKLKTKWYIKSTLLMQSLHLHHKCDLYRCCFTSPARTVSRCSSICIMSASQLFARCL